MKTDNDIIQTESMKGQECPFVKDKVRFCIEGWCEGCGLYEIYKEGIHGEKKDNRKV